MDNHEIAKLLAETADLMEIAGEDGFRIRSYRNAASVIEQYPEPLAAIAKDPEKKLTDVPGIGKGIASAIEEIEERGSFERRDFAPCEGGERLGENGSLRRRGDQHSSQHPSRDFHQSVTLRGIF